MRSAGFEPATPRFEAWCSIQLSYERTAAKVCWLCTWICFRASASFGSSVVPAGMRFPFSRYEMMSTLVGRRHRAGIARRHRLADALEEIADRKAVPCGREFGPGEPRRKAITGEIGLMAARAILLVGGLATLGLFFRVDAVPHGLLLRRDGRLQDHARQPHRPHCHHC